MNITSKGQKNLDDALKAIKAKSGSHSSHSSTPSNNTKQSFPPAQQASSGLSKPSSVFGEIEDEYEEENVVVKHVPQGVQGMNKTSTRTGRGFTSSSYIQDENNTNHLRLHKPTHQYFGEKLERMQRSEEETKNKHQSDLEVQNSRTELRKIRDMIFAERDRIPICLTCRLKFRATEDLEVHKSSEPHKQRCVEEKK